MTVSPRTELPGASHAGLFVAASVILSIIAIGAILAIFIVRPEKDNTQLMTMVLGFLLPIITALLGAALQQVHLAVNSRLSQLVELTAAASKAEGQLQAADTNSASAQAAAKLAAQHILADAADKARVIIASAETLAAQRLSGPSATTPIQVEVVNTPLATTLEPGR